MNDSRLYMIPSSSTRKRKPENEEQKAIRAERQRERNKKKRKEESPMFFSPLELERIRERNRKNQKSHRARKLATVDVQDAPMLPSIHHNPKAMVSFRSNSLVSSPLLWRNTNMAVFTANYYISISEPSTFTETRSASYLNSMLPLHPSLPPRRDPNILRLDTGLVSEDPHFPFPSSASSLGAVLIPSADQMKVTEISAQESLRSQSESIQPLSAVVPSLDDLTKPPGTIEWDPPLPHASHNDADLMTPPNRSRDEETSMGSASSLTSFNTSEEQEYLITGIRGIQIHQTAKTQIWPNGLETVLPTLVQEKGDIPVNIYSLIQNVCHGWQILKMRLVLVNQSLGAGLSEGQVITYHGTAWSMLHEFSLTVLNLDLERRAYDPSKPHMEGTLPEFLDDINNVNKAAVVLNLPTSHQALPTPYNVLDDGRSSWTQTLSQYRPLSPVFSDNFLSGAWILLHHAGIITNPHQDVDGEAVIWQVAGDRNSPSPKIWGVITFTDPSTPTLPLKQLQKMVSDLSFNLPALFTLFTLQQPALPLDRSPFLMILFTSQSLQEIYIENMDHVTNQSQQSINETLHRMILALPNHPNRGKNFDYFDDVKRIANTIIGNVLHVSFETQTDCKKQLSRAYHTCPDYRHPGEALTLGLGLKNHLNKKTST
ncbi:hypothetical protein F5877DRAFT_70142 [Lentinula edodes]|nr:hypothetical protein F5877DRAFT_70142 [Lentinula edodes]